MREFVPVAVGHHPGHRVRRAAASIDLDLGPSPAVKILGNSERVLPLQVGTIQLLRLYKERHWRRGACDHFFVNQRGGRFTRFGIRTIVKKYIRLGRQGQSDDEFNYKKLANELGAISEFEHEAGHPLIWAVSPIGPRFRSEGEHESAATHASPKHPRNGSIPSTGYRTWHR